MSVVVSSDGAARYNGRVIYADGCDYGVDLGDGYVIAYDDEEAARVAAFRAGGELVARDVYVSAWAKVE